MKKIISIVVFALLVILSFSNLNANSILEITGGSHIVVSDKSGSVNLTLLISEKYLKSDNTFIIPARITLKDLEGKVHYSVLTQNTWTLLPQLKLPQGSYLLTVEIFDFYSSQEIKL